MFWSRTLSGEHAFKVSGNIVLKKVIWAFERGSNKGLAEMHDEKTQYLCCSSHTVRVKESRRMRWMTGHAERIPSGRRKMHADLWWGNLKERAHLKYLGLDGRIMWAG